MVMSNGPKEDPRRREDNKLALPKSADSDGSLSGNLFVTQRAQFIAEWIEQNAELSASARESLLRRVAESDGIWNEPESVTGVYEKASEPGRVFISYLHNGEEFETPLPIAFKSGS